jgi:hypothetical protein
MWFSHSARLEVERVKRSKTTVIKTSEIIKEDKPKVVVETTEETFSTDEPEKEKDSKDPVERAKDIALSVWEKIK